MSTSSTEEIRESIPERIVITKMVDEVMGALKQSDEAAYKVWLLLGNRFGAGQKLWH